MGGFKEVSILFLICFQCLPAEEPEPDPGRVSATASDLRVTVNMYNGVNLSSGYLSRAQREAERIFLYAGIRLTWTTGLLAADLNDNATSKRGNAASLQLRLWPRAAAGIRPTSSETLGFCLSLENGDAVVLADDVKKRAIFGSTSFPDLLGLAMAHELGHLLLRSATHSVAGIMRARWTEKGLRDDDRGYLRFTPGEAESMRTEVRRRMRGQNSRQSPEAELKTKPALQVGVQVYNGAHVSSRDLLRAEERAGRVFRQANIVVIWSAGPMPKDPSPYAAPEQWVPSDLQVRIWTRSLAQPSMIDSDALGFCSSIEGGQAVVLFDAVRSLMRSRFSNPADLLGLAIAHEMGHILLRSVNHSTAGIMRARWLPKDLHDGETGSLVFTREQVDSMQNEVRRRMGIQIDCKR